MGKKGKKRAQAAAARAQTESTSSTDPTPSTSAVQVQHPSQQKKSSQKQLHKLQQKLQLQSEPQQQSQELSQPQLWGPSRYTQQPASAEQPAPIPQQLTLPEWPVSTSQPGSSSQQRRDTMQQHSSQEQFRSPHMQQFRPPSLSIHQPQVKDPSLSSFPQQKAQSSRATVQSAWNPNMPPVGYSSQFTPLPLQIVSTWPVPRHLQSALQQEVQEPSKVLQPSTSSQQVLSAGDLKQKQTKKSEKDKSKSTEKDDTSKAKATPSSERSQEMSEVSVWETKQKQMSERNLNVPRRQNPNKAGSAGLPIRVITNMFEIIFKPNFVASAVHYDIKVVPIDLTAKQQQDLINKKEPRSKREIKNKVLLRKIFEKWRSEYHPTRYPAYDGVANVFAAREFPFQNTCVNEIHIYDEERDEDRIFEITLTKAGVVDLSWMKTMKPGIMEANMNQTALQVLDVIMRHAPASRLISVGRSLFPPGGGGRAKALGNGLDLHVGGFTSAVIGWKPYLNVDVAHKAFAAPGNVINVICEIIGTTVEKLLPQDISRYEDKITKALNGLKVNYAIPNQPSSKRTHRINGLGPDSINHMFEVKGMMCSTEQYFAKFKSYKLNHPNFPCVWVGKKDGKTYLPAELCNIIPGQAVNRKLDDYQTTQMIRYAATNTELRKQKINTAVSGINVNNSDVMRNEFHLEVSTKMKEVDARILPAPSLQYSERTPVMVNKGVWRARRFNKPARLEDGTWTILNVCDFNIDNQLPDFVEQLKNQASSLGMMVGKPYTPYTKVRPVQFEIEKFFSFMKKLKLIIVILPNRTDAVYATVKKVSELRVGVLTQCIKMKNVNTPNNSTIQNILLKINSKLNGINHTFCQNTMPSCLKNKRYMLIGADVSHPSPDSKDIPSVAAVAASHDETTFKYNVTIRLQQPKQEEITDLKEIILKHLRFYANEMKGVPQVIIFYRDGVSEGQIGMVLEKEIKSIKDACKEYAREKPGFKPELTFVIVQKRHHVRIFPTRKEDSDDKNFNVKAGTIVDTEITHPSHIDFYLVSHASIQGTARPTKYRCICNESKFNEDQLEELTYHLCHMYARCTRSVSYPAPTYYAHLAAYRGRMWIQGDRYTEGDFQDKNKCKLEPKLNLPMSFI